MNFVEEKMFEMALKAYQNAYTPYSNLMLALLC